MSRASAFCAPPPMRALFDELSSSNDPASIAGLRRVCAQCPRFAMCDAEANRWELQYGPTERHRFHVDGGFQAGLTAKERRKRLRLGARTS